MHLENVLPIASTKVILSVAVSFHMIQVSAVHLLTMCAAPAMISAQPSSIHKVCSSSLVPSRPKDAVASRALVFLHQVRKGQFKIATSTEMMLATIG